MDELELSSPLYLVTSSEPCWKCSESQKVIAIATSVIKDEFETFGGNGEMYFVINIEEMPMKLYEYINAINPNYKKYYSHTADVTYYSNTCSCGANFGDFYLYSEPDGAFFPQSADIASSITAQLLPFNGQFNFIGGYCSVPSNIKFAV